MVNKQKKEDLNPKSKRKFILNLVIAITLGASSGLFLGLHHISQKTDPNLYNTDVSTLYDDVNAIIKESKGKTPIELGATKSCILAFENTFKHKNVKVVGVGKVIATMGVTQSINTRSIRIGDKIFSEVISQSKFVEAADRFYLENNKINNVKGQINGNETVWNLGSKNITTDKYKQDFGGALNEYVLYIVSSKTVKKQSKVEELLDGNFKFDLELDKVNSVINYVKNMKTSGDLSAFPEFRENIKLTITIDAGFKLVELVTHEVYGAKKSGIPFVAESDGTLTNKFYYDGNFKIPTIGESTKL